MTSDQQHSTHLGALCYAARRFDMSRIVEIGCGYFSTPALIEIATESYVAIENDANYFGIFSYVNEVQKCKIVHCGEEWNKWYESEIPTSTFVFVDAASYDMRHLAVRLSNDNNVPLVLLHDTENLEYAEDIALFKHSKTWNRFAPFTTLLSNVIEL